MGSTDPSSTGYVPPTYAGIAAAVAAATAAKHPEATNNLPPPPNPAIDPLAYTPPTSGPSDPHYKSGITDRPFFGGTYSLASIDAGIDTTSGNANMTASIVALGAKQDDSIKLGPVAFGSSQTFGSMEAFAGLKDGGVLGIGASYTALSLGGYIKPTLFGYGLKIGGSLDLGSAEASFKVSMKFAEVKLAAILGATLRLEVVTPNANP